MSRRNKSLQSFIDYCDAWPEQRFWQALCNWSGQHYILAAKGKWWDREAAKTLTDTYHWEDL